MRSNNKHQTEYWVIRLRQLCYKCHYIDTRRFTGRVQIMGKTHDTHDRQRSNCIGVDKLKTTENDDVPRTRVYVTAVK